MKYVLIAIVIVLVGLVGRMDSNIEQWNDQDTNERMAEYNAFNN